MNIYKNGSYNPAISYATIENINPIYSSTVTDYPTESSFYTYNKIAKPTEVSVTLVATNDEALVQLTQLQDTTALVDIATDTLVYAQYTLESFNYSLTRDTGTLLVAECKFKQVKIVSPQYAQRIRKPRRVSDSATQDRGQQQPKIQSTLSMGRKKIGW